MYADGMVADGPVADFLPPTGSAYAAVASVLVEPERKRAILELEQRVQQLEDVITRLIITGKEKPATYLGETGFTDERIIELARFTIEQRESERKQEIIRQDRFWSLFEKIAIFIIGAIAGRLLT